MTQIDSDMNGTDLLKILKSTYLFKEKFRDDLLVLPATPIAPEPAEASQVQGLGFDHGGIAEDLDKRLRWQIEVAEIIAPICANRIGDLF